MDSEITGTDPGIFEHFEVILEDLSNAHSTP